MTNDLISRQAVLDVIENGDWVDYDDSLCKLIEELPSITPTERTGHWIIHPKNIYAHLVCDKCLSNAPYDCRTNYCPKCGAKMIESEVI